MIKLTAKRRLRAGGRIVEPGDSFEASGVTARALKALGRAVDPVAEHEAQVDELRERAEALGIEVDRRWGIQRLQREIAAADEAAEDGGHYERRDMRARDE